MAEIASKVVSTVFVAFSSSSHKDVSSFDVHRAVIGLKQSLTCSFIRVRRRSLFQLLEHLQIALDSFHRFVRLELGWNRDGLDDINHHKSVDHFRGDGCENASNNTAHTVTQDGELCPSKMSCHKTNMTDVIPKVIHQTSRIV